MKNISYLKELYKGFSHFTVLLLSFVLAFITSGITRALISQGDTYNVLNVHNDGGFSPEQNFVKIIIIITGTVIYYKILYKLFSKKPSYFKVVILILSLFFILLGNVLPTANSNKQNIDMFHIGEQLSPAKGYNDGKSLYKDMFVIHGAGEDVLLPALALKASNGSNGIGYYFFIRGFLIVISAGLFLTLLFKLFRDPLTYMLIVAWFLLGEYSQFYYVRDIFTWSALLLVFYIFNTNGLKRHKYSYAYAALGAISSLAIFYSFDRGVIALLFATLVAASSIFISKDMSGKVKLSIPKVWRRFTNLGATLLGILSMQSLILITIGAAAYKEFIQTYFIDIPKYQGLLFNYPLPGINETSLLIWLPIIIVSIALIAAIDLIRDAIKDRSWDKNLLVALYMVIIGIVFLRIGYGRSDHGHIAYSTPLLFVSVFYILQLYLQRKRIKFHQIWLPASILLLLFIPQATVRVDRVASLSNLDTKAIYEYRELLRTDDNEWLTDNVKNVVRHVKESTDPSDSIFVLTQQPLYYYLTERANPTRFYIPWFADSDKLEKELLESLMNNSPKLIIYSSGDGWDNVDGFNMSERTPKVDRWIKDNYKSKSIIGGVVILTE